MNDAPWTGGGESGTCHTGSRRTDGRPETERDRRFFDLRAAGYDGPIDQDGYPAHVEGTGLNARIVRD